jgi:hypothetical protein
LLIYRNNVLDSVKDLVLNYEQFNANSTAVINTILNKGLRTFRIVEDNNWIDMNIFRSSEINSSQIYYDLSIEHSTIIDNQAIFQRKLEIFLSF